MRKMLKLLVLFVFSVISAYANDYISLDYGMAEWGGGIYPSEGSKGGSIIAISYGRESLFHDRISFEVEYTQTLDKPSYERTLSDDAFKTTLSYTTLGAIFTYNFPVVEDKVVVGPRLGLLLEEGNLKTKGGSNTVGSYQEMGLVFGLMASYRINDRYALIVKYTDLENFTTHTTLGVKYFF